MSRIRVMMVFILSAVVFYGIWKYYTVNQNIYFQDPVAPVREMITENLDLEALPNQIEHERSLLTRLLQYTKPDMVHNNTISNQIHPEFSSGKITQQQLQTIVNNGYVKGDEMDSQLLLLDFCHFQSKYCKEATIEGAINRYLTVYSGSLSYQFRSYPPQSDESTLSPHIALQCAGQLGDEISYFKFLHGLYLLDVYTLASYQELANGAGIDGFSSCILQQPTTLKIRQQMKLSDELFDIAVLPTYILLDKDSGQYIKIPGLYQDKYVYKAISLLLSQ